jgi:hypothetical protein
MSVRRTESQGSEQGLAGLHLRICPRFKFKIKRFQVRVRDRGGQPAGQSATTSLRPGLRRACQPEWYYSKSESLPRGTATDRRLSRSRWSPGGPGSGAEPEARPGHRRTTSNSSSRPATAVRVLVSALESESTSLQWAQVGPTGPLPAPSALRLRPAGTDGLRVGTGQLEDSEELSLVSRMAAGFGGAGRSLRGARGLSACACACA